MKALVIYESKYGNTEQIARALVGTLAPAIPTEMHSVTEQQPAFEGIDLLLVGGPTQAHGVSPALREFLSSLPREVLAGVRTAAFDTRLRGIKLLTGSAANRIDTMLRRRGATPISEPESFLVTGGEGPLVEGEIARAETWAGAILQTMGIEASTGMVAAPR